MSIVRTSYKKGSVEQFFRTLVSQLNKISEEPLDEEKNHKIRIPFFPFIWDLNQFYFLLKELYRLKLFDNMGFVITNRDYSEIFECFLFKFIETGKEEIGTGQPRFDFKVISLDRKNKKYYKELKELIANFDVRAFKFVQNFAQKEFNFDLGLLFILPEHIAHLGVQDTIDYINSDVVRYFKDFIGLLRKGLGQEMKKMPVIELSSKANRNNPLINMFIKFASEWMGVNVNQIFDFFTQMMEGLTMNLLLVSKNKKPISIGRIIIENGIIHVNPVPLEFIKEQLTNIESKSITELARILYTRTKTNTLTIEIDQFYQFLMNFNDPEYTILSALLDIIQLSNLFGTYPESIFTRLLSEIGIDADKLLLHLNDTIKSIVKYYERILVATLVVNPKGKRELNSLFYLGVSDKGNLIHKQLDTKKYKIIFDNKKTTTAIGELEETITANTNLEFPLIVIIKLKILTELFSLQNLQSIAEMNRFKQSLPSLEKLAGIITELSRTEILENDEIRKEEAKQEPSSQGSLIEELPSINHFLTKGITIKTSKDKTFIFKGDAENKGYLGLNIKKLQEFIKRNFPEILLD
ncbi:MAG: hypothetical protein JW776_00800 [Candidatus Lokiarchaeota archaeon]|nr:hypothetical protein [Candidatus Lokiarchaeota archaeon]